MLLSTMLMFMVMLHAHGRPKFAVAITQEEKTQRMLAATRGVSSGCFASARNLLTLVLSRYFHICTSSDIVPKKVNEVSQINIFLILCEISVI